MTKDKNRDRINGLAGVAELADAPDLGSGVPDVKVQVLSPVPNRKALPKECFSIWYRHINKDLKGSGNEWEPKWLPEPRLGVPRSELDELRGFSTDRGA